MSAPYCTAAVANWFLDRAAKDSKSLDPMKLQKLIYFAHGWFLALANLPLIDEHIQAWDYGPVVPSIYHEFKKYGRTPINDRATRIEFPESADVDSVSFLLETRINTPTITNDLEVERLLERVWSVYGKYSGVELANMSHVENGAWDLAYKDAKGRKSVEISDDLIKQEFEAKRAKNRAAATQP